MNNGFSILWASDEWLKPRYIVLLNYPKSPFIKGDIIDALECDINLSHFNNHFALLKWHQHRTIEQLRSIRYMKVVSRGNYYGIGDIVEVTDMRYNDTNLVGGKDSILFSLKGHYFSASQLEPATEDDYKKFKQK